MDGQGGNSGQFMQAVQGQFGPAIKQALMRRMGGPAIQNSQNPGTLPSSPPPMPQGGGMMPQAQQSAPPPQMAPPPAQAPQPAQPTMMPPQPGQPQVPPGAGGDPETLIILRAMSQYLSSKADVQEAQVGANQPQGGGGSAY